MGTRNRRGGPDWEPAIYTCDQSDCSRCCAIILSTWWVASVVLEATARPYARSLASCCRARTWPMSNASCRASAALIGAASPKP